MFNGIIESQGIIKQIDKKANCLDLAIESNERFHDLILGESIALNGVCLTVTHFSNKLFHVTVVPETMRVTNLAYLSVESRVNLERALSVSGRISGHYVQGHVDAIGEVIELKKEGDAMIAKIRIPSHLTKYIVNKGYIAMDGMSITIIQAEDDWFTVTFIPHTIKATIINQYRKGTKLNIEVDMLNKYIEKLFGVYTKCNPILNALNPQ